MVYQLSSTVTLIETLNLALILLTVLLAALGAQQKVIRGLAVLVAVMHVTYIAAYTKAYNLRIQLYPFLDVLVGEKGCSAVIDVAQLSVILIAIDYTLSRLKEKTYKHPR